MCESSDRRARDKVPEKMCPLPRRFLFFSHTIEGGGMPVASHARLTELLIVSTTTSCSGPSILGGTVERVDAAATFGATS